MKTDCEKLISLLQEQTEIVLEEADKNHLVDCESCRRLLANHERSFNKLKQDLTIPLPRQAAILVNVQKMIADQKISKNQHLNFSLPLWLSEWRTQVVWTVLLLIAMTGIWYSHSFLPGETIQISGSATILKNFKKIALKKTVIQLKPGERVTLINGKIDLLWQNSASVSIDGMLDFVAHEKSIIANNGQATLTFLPTASGYIISTRLMLVKILGTTVILELDDNQESVSVVKGKVEWSLVDGKEKREVAAGVKMIVTRHPDGLKVVEDICEKKTPQSSSNGLLDVNGGIGVKKIGNNWKPLEKN